jgi:hypothetical protein
MKYWRPCEINDLLTLILYLNEKNSFGYEEIMRMPAHITIGLWGQKRKILEDRSKEHEKQNGGSGSSGAVTTSSINSAMSQVRSMQNSFKAPSVNLPR